MLDIEKIEKAAAVCRYCELHSGRIRSVFAKGNPAASLMICGMVPGPDENQIGLPFVGRAGKLLDNVLGDLGILSEEVYITNLVKCFLQPGKPLKPEWIHACLPYIISQITIIRPKVIITLGADASMTLLGLDPKENLMRNIRGEVFDYTEQIKVVPTYHPSYILRQGGVNSKAYGDIVVDFKKALYTLNEISS